MTWNGAILSAVVAMMLTAGCATGSDPLPAQGSSPSASNSPTVSGGAASPAATSAPATARLTSVALTGQLDHVHGLVATGAGSVVAGTHSGARSVDIAGRVSAPGPGRDDLMGMTGEAGTGRLASSGHPGPGSSLPNPVGLIVSDDGGRSWMPVSLQGEGDFHALAVHGADVIGFGHGSLLISDDGGRTWRRGAALEPLSLAHTGGRVLAATRSGLAVSTDGGMSFAPATGSPDLVLLSAGADKTVLGLDVRSTVWSSTDAGRTWGRVGLAPGAQAVAALRNGAGFAISETTLFVIT